MTIPVTVIGGYLGAGKTTLVNHLLRHAAGARLAVLVNDFGELAIDADLIEAEDDGVISIAGGCVCCSFGSDLMTGLVKLAARTPTPDHVLVETSGVALPDVVARSVTLVPGFTLDGVVVVADAETALQRAADRYMADTIERQLGAADLVVLNKCDLVAPPVLAAIRKRWAAPMIDACRARVPIPLLLGARLSTGEAVRRRHDAQPGDDAAGRYDRAAVLVGYRLDVSSLAKTLTRSATGVLRAKGVLNDRDGTARVIHVVGARSDVTTAADTSRVRGLVCIGLAGQLDRVAIELAIAAAAVRPT